MIYSLNLDPNFIPITTIGIQFEKKVWSGGEIHIRILTPLNSSDKVIITHRLNNSVNIMELMLATNALHQLGILNINVIIPYLPYARQDRVCNPGEALSIQLMADLINMQSYGKVHVLDVHSNISKYAIDRCDNISNKQFIYEALRDYWYSKNDKVDSTAEFNQWYCEPKKDDFYIITPDVGGYHKTYEAASAIKYTGEIIQSIKHRNMETGNIDYTHIYHEDFEGKDCLIFDDICDGGRTFIEIAKQLKTKNCGKILLFVSHGIFCNGFEELKKYFDKIYTTNSIKDIDNKLVTQIKIQI
jgi:ribose-phosphate pyrophosphokinase